MTGKKSSMMLILAAALLLCLSVPAGASGTIPQKPAAADKCPVCGMFVAKYTEWIARIEFSDGTYAFFDGPKDMFRYYFNLAKYNPSKSQKDITGMYVTEYYTTELRSAYDMHFVAGSNVYGPMGKELIPVESEDHAREFLKDHAGREILRFTEITVDDLN